MAYTLFHFSPGEKYISGSGAGQVLDASGEKQAFMTTVPVTGSITGIVFSTVAHTTNGTCRVSLQTVDASTGNPTGTLVATNVTADVSITATGLYTATFTAAYSATAGGLLACVFEWVSGNWSLRIGSGFPNSNFPYSSTYLTTWTKGTQRPCFSFVYGTAYHNSFGASGSNTTTVNVGTTSSPDEIGNKIVLPFGYKISGVHVNVLPNNAGRTYDLVLYDSSGTAQRTYSKSDTDYLYAVSGTTIQTYHFSSAYEVAANAEVYLILKPTTANVNTLYKRVFVSSDHKKSEMFGEYFTAAQRTDAGSWTTDTSGMFDIFPIISEIDFPTSSGSGLIVHPGMAGGMRG